MYSDFISAPIFSERPIDGIVFIAMEEEYLDAAFSFCMQVRRHMIRSGYFHPGMKDGFGSDKLSLKGMIRLANRMKFSDCVIIGSREIEANEYEVKDLKYHGLCNEKFKGPELIEGIVKLFRDSEPCQTILPKLCQG